MSNSIRVAVSYVDEDGEPLAFPNESLTVPVAGQGVVDPSGNFYRVKDVWQVHTSALTTETPGVTAVLKPEQDSSVPKWLFRKVKGEEPPPDIVYMA